MITMVAVAFGMTMPWGFFWPMVETSQAEYTILMPILPKYKEIVILADRSRC